MSQTSVKIFAFAAVYVGDATATGTPLARVLSTRTKGAKLVEALPSKFEPVLGNAIQTDNHTFRITLTFLGDDDQAILLARGLSVLASSTDLPPQQTQYSLFLQSPMPLVKSSYFFPVIRTERVVEVNYEKGAPTELKITFIAESRDATVQLHYKQPDATLVGIMGAQSPI